MKLACELAGERWERIRIRVERMKTWEELDSRQRDAWVATTLFDWEWLIGRVTEDYSHGAPITVPCPPFRELWRGGGDDEERWNGTDDLPLGNYAYEAVPRYSCEIRDDYRVLELAREWPREQHNRFCQSIDDIWTGRGFDEWSFAAYKPGDYSHAAYLASAEVVG